MRTHNLLYLDEIMILDMATILTQVHRDAVGARLLYHDRRFDGARVWRAARLAQGSYVVNVDAKVYRVGCHIGILSRRG
jgi:hypothetical protein